MARILVIDDDAHLLQMLGLMLERAGHEPILAADGQKGLDLSAESPPDMAIVDVMMPEMSGHEVIRRLRARPETVDIPILTLTARSQPVDRETALDVGATGFMTKPVSPRELATRVDEMLLGVSTERKGCIVTFVSLRGGVGVTTMAVNLAGALRVVGVPNITLVDCSPNSGHAAMLLRLRPRTSWADLLEQPDWAADSVRSVLVAHPSGINLMPAPALPTFDVGLPESKMNLMLDVLRRRARFVVVDAPPVLNSMAVSSLKSADLVVVVLTAEVASIQSVVLTLRKMVELGISGKRIHILLNRTSNQPGVPKAALERAVRRPVSFDIPFDPYQGRAMAQGMPLTLEGVQSPLAVTMRRVAAALAKSF